MHTHTRKKKQIHWHVHTNTDRAYCVVSRYYAYWLLLCHIVAPLIIGQHETRQGKTAKFVIGWWLAVVVVFFCCRWFVSFTIDRCWKFCVDNSNYNVYLVFEHERLSCFFLLRKKSCCFVSFRLFSFLSIHTLFFVLFCFFLLLLSLSLSALSIFNKQISSDPKKKC